jgi:hypothetical protein
VIFETKKIYDDVQDAFAPAEQLDDTMEYIALMSLIKIEIEERIGNALNQLYKATLQ